MPKELYEISTTAASNNFATTDGGWPEGMQRSEVNGAARENLAMLRRFYNDSEWIRVRFQGPLPANVGVFTRTGTNTFTITLAGVDLSSYFKRYRVIKIVNGTSPGVDLVTQVNADATYGSGVTTVTTVAAMAVGSTDAYAHASSVLRRQALLEDRTDFFIPVTADSAGIQAACTAAAAAGNGVVLLTAASYSITTQIDLTTGNGNFSIWGAGMGTTLTRAAAINAIFNVDVGASEHIAIENVRFNVNVTTHPTGNAQAVSLVSAASFTMRNCEINDCKIGVSIASATINRLFFTGNLFRYRTAGISTTAATDVHEGQIFGNIFDGSIVDVALAAAVKLAGSWRVTGNLFRNTGHASLAPYGVWMWDKSSTTTGGKRSAVTGNSFQTSAATGISAWLGADDITFSGNTIVTSTTGTAVQIGGITAGNPAERVICQGNSINGGAKGIVLLELSQHSVVSGNSIVPASAGVGVEVGGDNNVVSNNIVRGSGVTTGIEITGTASNNHVFGNHFADLTTNGILIRALASSNVVRGNTLTGTPTNGINIESTAASNLVEGNYLPNLATPLTNASATTRYARNEDLPYIVFATGTAAIATTASKGNAPISNQNLPGGGGRGQYLIEWAFTVIGGGPDITFDVCFGATGTPSTDGTVFSETVVSGAPESSTTLTESYVTVTDALAVKWSVGATRSTATGSGTATCKITKISDPLG